MESGFQFYVRTSSQIIYAWENGVGLVSDAGSISSFIWTPPCTFLGKSVSDFIPFRKLSYIISWTRATKLQNLWKPDSKKYCTPASQTFSFWKPASKKWCTPVPQNVQHFNQKFWFRNQLPKSFGRLSPPHGSPSIWFSHAVHNGLGTGVQMICYRRYIHQQVCRKITV